MQRPRTKLNSQIYEEASAWFVESRAEDLDEAGRREFDAWLRKSPEHLCAYLEIAAIWNEGSTLGSAPKYDREQLLAAARSDPDNVIALESQGPPVSPPYPDSPHHPDTIPHGFPPAIRTAASGRRRTARRLAAATAVAAIAVGGTLWWTTERNVYSTATGEQRSVVLADGSSVELNTRSRIRVSFEKGERHVALLDGEALFHVAKDSSRPFIVSAGDTKVRAVGTQFDVNRKAGATVVTVIEGRVAVLHDVGTSSSQHGRDSGTPAGAGSAGPEPTFLSAGEQATVTAQVARRADHPNVSSATAWTQRQLVFEDATLSDVADEFNRYNERRLVIEDPALYGFHISGVFSSTDPKSLIRFLRGRPGVQITETDTEIRVKKIFQKVR